MLAPSIDLIGQKFWNNLKVVTVEESLPKSCAMEAEFSTRVTNLRYKTCILTSNNIQTTLIVLCGNKAQLILYLRIYDCVISNAHIREAFWVHRTVMQHLLPNNCKLKCQSWLNIHIFVFCLFQYLNYNLKTEENIASTFYRINVEPWHRR